MQQIDMFLEGQSVLPVEGRDKFKEPKTPFARKTGPTIPFGDPKIEYVGDNSTLQITMADGTVYGGLNPKNKPIPVPQGSYDAGREGLINVGASILEDSMSSNTLLTGGQAKIKINTKITELKGNSRQNLDLLFTDLTPDDSNVTFADEFAKGGLDKSFYIDDQNQQIITYKDKPAFDKDGKWQWTEREAKDFLRESMNQKENMDRFSTYLGNAFADMHNTKVKERRGLANTYFMSSSGELFDTNTKIKAAKVSEYTDMFVDNIYSKYDLTGMTMGAKGVENYRGIKEDLKKQFKNTGITVDIEMKSAPKDERETLIAIGVGSQERQFDLSDPSDVAKMKQYLQESDYIQSLQLGPNPSEWKDLSGNDLNLLRQ